MRGMRSIWVSSRGSMSGFMLKRWWSCWSNRMSCLIRYMQGKENREWSRREMDKCLRISTMNYKSSWINCPSTAANTTKSIQRLSIKLITSYHHPKQPADWFLTMCNKSSNSFHNNANHQWGSQWRIDRLGFLRSSAESTWTIRNYWSKSSTPRMISSLWTSGWSWCRRSSRSTRRFASDWTRSWSYFITFYFILI